MPEWQDQVELHRIYQEARNHRDSFFERLAILDGGTVALVITAVLGPLHGSVQHKYVLAIGLTCLVFAMLTLLLRNLLAAQLEFHSAGQTANDPILLHPKLRKQAALLSDSIRYSQYLGAILSGLGVLLLLVEVWLILFAPVAAG